MLKKELMKIIRMAEKNKKLSLTTQNAELIDKHSKQKDELEEISSERFFNEMKHRDF